MKYIIELCKQNLQIYVFIHFSHYETMVSLNHDKFTQDSSEEFLFENGSCFIPIKDLTTDTLEFKIKDKDNWETCGILFLSEISFFSGDIDQLPDKSIKWTIKICKQHPHFVEVIV